MMQPACLGMLLLGWGSMVAVTPCHSWTIIGSGTATTAGSGSRNFNLARVHRAKVQRSASSNDEIEIEYDDSEARSQFGTKDYWDELYQGMGDFPMDEYEWYFGFEKYWRLVQTHVPSKTARILVPGIGNDPVLLELLQKGYTRLTATDYSEHAIERQQDLLSFQNYEFSLEQEQPDDDNELTTPVVRILPMDARNMPQEWTDNFDAILEKGALDAIYLSGDGNVERTVAEFERVLKPNTGVLISVSGVVPPELRRDVFGAWNWIRDGSDDIEAGCFVLENTNAKTRTAP